MDRILRPTGFIIVRDTKVAAEFIKNHLTSMHWDLVAQTDAEPDSDPQDGDTVLVIQKKMWAVEELKDSA